MDLTTLADNLRETEPGFWVASGDHEVSYPQGGHDLHHELESESFWYRHRTACILAALDRWSPPGPVFDVGGGTGYLASSLNAAGHPAVLVEPGDDGAQIGWDRGLRPVVRATTRTAGFHAESLPAVGVFDVVEHVEDDLGFLGHLHDLLQHGGLLYATVPAHQWLWSVDDVRAGHHRRYDRPSLRSALVSSGFVLEYLTAFFRPLPVPLLAVRAIPSRLGLRDIDDNAAAARDHRGGGGVAARLVDRLLAPEVHKIAAGRSMRAGTSLLAVARRP